MLAPILQDGFEVQHVRLAEGRESLIASTGGAPTARALCFTGHFDAVPLGTAPWSVHPHGGEVRGGFLFGRGAADMKSGIAAFIAAAAGFSRSLRLGPGVMLVLTASEETGCQGAMQLASVPIKGGTKYKLCSGLRGVHYRCAHSASNQSRRCGKRP
jgi:succinyl-diaminopimelate desuccinylase